MANEYMMVSSITNVLGQAKDCLVDLGESWIDSKLPENLFKEVPIIKMLMLGRTGVRTVKECHEVRQISQFLLTIDTECTDEARRKRYIKVLNENAKQFEKELEYVTIVVTNYLESEKPQMLGRLYQKRLDGGLSWEEFAEYASMLNLSLIHISEPTRRTPISYAVFCLKKKKKKKPIIAYSYTYL